MVNRITFLGIALAVILGLDQASKLYIEKNLPLYHSVEVVPNIFNITHIRNTGVAFGLFAGEKTLRTTLFLLILSAVAIGAISYFYFVLYSKKILSRLALALVLGGAIGNLIDRIRLQEVIDFIDLHWYHYHWPAFNIADSCITIGLGLFILESLLTKDTTN
jgi:signal peptidase II